MLAKFRVERALLEGDLNKINQALALVESNIEKLRNYVKMHQSNIYTKDVVSSFMVKNTEIFVDKIISTIAVAERERSGLDNTRQILMLRYKQLLNKIEGLDDLAKQRKNRNNILLENIENQELIDMLNSYSTNSTGKD
jgi:hypothetical protein